MLTNNSILKKISYALNLKIYVNENIYIYMHTHTSIHRPLVFLAMKDIKNSRVT